MSEAELKKEAEELVVCGLYTEWMVAKLMRISLGRLRNRKVEGTAPPMTPEGTIPIEDFNRWNRNRLLRGTHRAS